MKPSVLRPSGGGWEHSIGDEIVFTVCRKLITRNKLISRYSFRINCIFTEVTASDGSSSSDKGWTHKGGGWHGGEGGGRYWIMKLISAMALLPDALDNSIRNYLKRSFVVALIAPKVFCPPPPRCAHSICWGSCLSRMAQCTLTARLLFCTMWLCFRMKKAKKNQNKKGQRDQLELDDTVYTPPLWGTSMLKQTP